MNLYEIHHEIKCIHDNFKKELRVHNKGESVAECQKSYVKTKPNMC